ncbi:hypothetical protein DEO72_LG8g2487 [Vigna unguiculata]|uniref:Uncharacterized protein n=1 Tax=Vigna unguiculata TaxID=3917 RepID=A0A4D6MUY4_VIGUN|nr:hypothetical protein DEO72_LG8g2487 [Vigna unguiculata]
MFMFICYLEPQLKGCHSQPKLKECHVFTLYLEPQLNGYCSEPQLKEHSSKSIFKSRQMKFNYRPPSGSPLSPNTRHIYSHCLYGYRLAEQTSLPGATRPYCLLELQLSSGGTNVIARRHISTHAVLVSDLAEHFHTLPTP